MSHTLSLVGTAVAVFVSTNVDNTLVLLALFADARLQPRAVVAGQLVGMGVIILGSALAAILAARVPDGYVAFLGTAPLAIGLRRMWSLWTERPLGAVAQAESAATGVLEAEQRIGQRTHSDLLATALITIANGGDNVGVYVPLFARTPKDIPTFLSMFAILTAASCLGAYRVAKGRIVGHTVQTVGHVILPFLLVVIGLWTLRGIRMLLE